ncbi:hypothetical protein GCM10010193_16160 [Kitasatospora atroaurantiaca]|uniref:Uncharacterized protein n=1 Tax=Kitasatospora atroaurantiaca TaxID=285545 RepID=A0A561EXI5_9ACTN|nr:hypothetical protein [Kitasatospora atroaurantiaca]TWE20323.1 hypothetical protein FB465_5472 [Kitasatospora atroaurantiaca]
MEATEPGTRPYLVLTGFALLLVLVFGGAFAAGRAAGPVSPGLVPGTSGTGHSGDDMPGMTGHDMGAAR